MTAQVPEVDIKSRLKQRADQRAKDEEAALKAAQERADTAVPEAHLALHDYFQHLADQHPDSELEGLTAMSDGAERFVQLIQVGIERAASLPGSTNGTPQLNTATSVRELESQVRQLEADNRGLLAEVSGHAATETSLEIAQRDVANLRRDVAKLQGQIQAKDEKIEQLETEATMADDSQELAEAKAKISDLESQISVMQASHAQILRDKDAEIARLTSIEADLQSVAAGLRAENARLVQQLNPEPPEAQTGTLTDDILGDQDTTSDAPRPASEKPTWGQRRAARRATRAAANAAPEHGGGVE